MWRHYVYVHYAPDGTPFYVGKGSCRKTAKRQVYWRANEPRNSNEEWLACSKNGFRVEIYASCVTDEEACRLEQELIDGFGRKDLNRGLLVNKTDGGEGSWGLVASSQLRAKRSLNARRKRSDVWVASIRASRKNAGNGGTVKFGDKLPESWRKSISNGKLGAKNPWFGKPSPASRKVRNRLTGEIYPTIKSAADLEGIKPRRKLYRHLESQRYYPECDHLEKL